MMHGCLCDWSMACRCQLEQMNSSVCLSDPGREHAWSQANPETDIIIKIEAIAMSHADIVAFHPATLCGKPGNCK